VDRIAGLARSTFITDETLSSDSDSDFSEDERVKNSCVKNIYSKRVSQISVKQCLLDKTEHSIKMNELTNIL
jgi:hypothetical protein